MRTRLLRLQGHTTAKIRGCDYFNVHVYPINAVCFLPHFDNPSLELDERGESQ